MAPAKFSKDCGVGQSQVEGSGGNRGRKRQHGDMECTDSCDCEEFGLPLAKKINQMNIEYENRANLSQNNQQGVKVPDDFLAKYPFPKESPYYSSNMMLAKLYAERVQRNPNLKHNPT
eukprot:GFUD01075293.1.p1 GENE.GFUD01075293.1~~GFUD01075293.1.p1  ORF type:complete len:118 (-),score=39.59 GFUD01075293.1:120-473(-)